MFWVLIGFLILCLPNSYTYANAKELANEILGLVVSIRSPIVRKLDDPLRYRANGIIKSEFKPQTLAYYSIKKNRGKQRFIKQTNITYVHGGGVLAHRRKCSHYKK
jgi:hypothetical protein